MFNIKITVFLLLLPISISAQPDLNAWLKKADSYRLPAESVKVHTQVRLYKDDELTHTKTYDVYVKPGRRSLVVFKTPGEIGQKVLMQGNHFHIFLPRSRRAIRITPMQRLLGEASTGDIATMTWHEDYKPALMSGSLEFEGIPCVALQLTSKRNVTTYHRVELYLQRDTFRPVFARLFLTSGKLAKEARFYLDSDSDEPAIGSMTLTDRINTRQRTEVRYLSMQPMSIPNKYYNPQFLLRAQLR